MKNKLLNKFLVVSLASVLATGEINLLTSSAYSLFDVKLNGKQNGAYQDVLTKIEKFVNKNINIKAKACGLNDEYWAKKAITNKNEFSIFNNNEQAYETSTENKGQDFAESIKNLKTLIAWSYVIDENQRNMVVDKFFENIKSAMSIIIATEKDGRNKDQLLKCENSLLGLINGWMCFEALYANWLKCENGVVSSVRINPLKSEAGTYKNADEFFASIFTNKEGLFDVLMEKLKKISVGNKTAADKLSDIISRRSNSGQSMSVGAYFKHDFDCYLTQFWVICDGFKSNKEKVTSVVKKTVGNIVNDLGRKQNNEILKNSVQKGHVSKNNQKREKGQNNIINNNIHEKKQGENIMNATGQSNLNKKNIENKQIGANIINKQQEKIGNGGSGGKKKISLADYGHFFKDENGVVDSTCKVALGLNNIGATCYKDSLLQCLCHTKELAEYFLNPDKEKYIMESGGNYANKNNRDSLVLGFKELVKNIWDKDKSGKKFFSPYVFMNLIERMTKNDAVKFKVGEAGDAKDFVLYILEQLHKELKRPAANLVEAPKDQLNQYDKENALQHFLAEFQEETSIISDLFYGVNETTNVCQDCKFTFLQKGQNYPICYNYGIFNVLIFPLDEVRKQFENTNWQIPYKSGIPVVNLWQCFNYNQKTDLFTGDNKNYCNICRKLWDSKYTSKIYSPASNLIMILNRGKGNEFKIKLDFNEYIKLDDFIVSKNADGYWYELYGVVTHIGESGPNAHFIASCRSPSNGQWVRYNDAIVNKIEDFKKDVHDFGNPYILFYRRVDASKVPNIYKMHPSMSLFNNIAGNNMNLINFAPYPIPMNTFNNMLFNQNGVVNNFNFQQNQNNNQIQQMNYNFNNNINNKIQGS